MAIYYRDGAQWHRNTRGAWTAFVPPDPSFDFTITTTSPNEIYYTNIFVQSGGSLTIDWGDGNEETITTSSYPQHTYTTADTYTVSISESLLCDYTFENDTNIDSIDTVFPSSFTGIIYADSCFKFSTIQTVPSGLFDNVYSLIDLPIAANSIDFGEMFSNSSITTIPSGFFDFVVDINPLLEDVFVDSMFVNCTSLTSLPDDLFQPFLNANSANGQFFASDLCNGCTALTSVGDLFNPSNLYEGYFLNAFKGCTSISSISTNILDYLSDEAYLVSMFENCTTLTTIPLLFANHSGVTTYRVTDMFKGCTGVTAYPTGLFDTLDATTTTHFFGGCFANCTSMSNAADDIWNDFPTPSSSDDCFLNDTNLSNYASIPTGWK